MSPSSVIPKQINVPKNLDKIMSIIQEENKERLNSISQRSYIESSNKDELLYMGDEIKVSYYTSLSKKRIVNFIGKIIDIHRTNLSSSFLVESKVNDVKIFQRFPLFSPMILELQIIKKGGRRFQYEDPSQYLLEMYGVKRRFH